jgi:hypothetical protein
LLASSVMVASRTGITQEKLRGATAATAAKAAVEATRTEDNDEYKDAIEECALAMNEAGYLTTEEAPTEERALTKGAAPDVQEPSLTKSNGKGKGGYGKSQSRPEAWPIPLKVPKQVQKEYIQDVLEDIPPNAANVLGPLQDTAVNAEQTLIESDMEESDQMNTKEVAALATEYYALTPGDKDEPVNEVDSDGTINTKDKDRSSRWKRNPREEEEQSGRSRSRNPIAADNNEHNPTARKRTVKGNRSDTDDNERHFLQLTQTQQGIANTSEHNTKEDNKKKKRTLK